MSERATAGFNGKMAENSLDEVMKLYDSIPRRIVAAHNSARRTNSILNKLSWNLTSVTIILSNLCIYRILK